MLAIPTFPAFPFPTAGYAGTLLLLWQLYLACEFCLEIQVTGHTNLVWKAVTVSNRFFIVLKRRTRI